MPLVHSLDLSTGNVRITDFGLSHKLEHSKKRVVSYSGTAIYLAPEMLSDFGHGFAVDWWAVGVLAFIMLTQEVRSPRGTRRA